MLGTRDSDFVENNLIRQRQYQILCFLVNYSVQCYGEYYPAFRALRLEKGHRAFILKLNSECDSGLKTILEHKPPPQIHIENNLTYLHALDFVKKLPFFLKLYLQYEKDATKLALLWQHFIAQAQECRYLQTKGMNLVFKPELRFEIPDARFNRLFNSAILSKFRFPTDRSLITHYIMAIHRVDDVKEVYEVLDQAIKTFLQNNVELLTDLYARVEAAKLEKKAELEKKDAEALVSITFCHKLRNLLLVILELIVSLNRANTLWQNVQSWTVACVQKNAAVNISVKLGEFIEAICDCNNNNKFNPEFYTALKNSLKGREGHVSVLDANTYFEELDAIKEIIAAIDEINLELKANFKDKMPHQQKCSP